MNMKGLCFKICILFYIITVLGTALVSCSGKKPPAEQTNENNTDEKPIIALSGISEYTLIRPMNADEDLLNKVTGVYSAIREKTGAALAMNDDFLTNGETPSGRKEILIGFTNRTETKTVMDSIGYFDYAIRRMGDKIVIAAHTKDALMQALDVFCEELLEPVSQNGADAWVLKEERTGGTGQYEFFFSENPLGQYRIVYPDGNAVLKRFADQMAGVLQKKFSTSLPVVSDRSEPADFEILLGVTSREAYASCYTGAEAPDSMHYLIRAEGSHLLIVGTNDRSAELACTRFLQEFLNDRYTNRFNLPDGCNRYEVAYAYDRDSLRSPEVDLRIMSYNILSEELTNTALPVTQRKDLLLTTVLYYLPDVIGLQEVSATGWAMLEQELGDWYGLTGQQTPLGASSYTGLAYNRRTVRLLESENVLYSVGNKRIRLMSWGLFEHLETGKQFVVMSTHWDIVLDNRQTDAIEMTALVNQLREKYHCPVMTTGDFNTLESTPYFKKYLTDTAQTEARYSAAEIGFALQTEVIDHITATNDLEPLFFKLLQTPQTKEASDHNPIFADYRFRDIT